MPINGGEGLGIQLVSTENWSDGREHSKTEDYGDLTVSAHVADKLDDEEWAEYVMGLQHTSRRTVACASSS